MKNLKTTALGILTILAAVSNAGIGLINGTPFDYAATLAAITAGLGLIFARDATPADK